VHAFLRTGPKPTKMLTSVHNSNAVNSPINAVSALMAL